jgi:hypothetical protein
MSQPLKAVAVGVFADHTQADRAVAELKQAGFRNDQVGVAGRDWRGESAASAKHGTEVEEGALAGALTGAGLGGLVGLGVLAGVIPVFGPAITAGTLGILLSNAAAGATLAGVAGALVGMGIPEEEAHHYGNEFLAGRYIVTVMTGGRTEEALVVLRRCGAAERATGAVTA